MSISAEKNHTKKRWKTWF